LGYDFSPNGNNWTTNNISLTAGSTYDSMTDVPTLTSATAANYWTFNPLIPVSGATYSNGNLQYTNSNNNKSGFSSPLPTTGKWYWEGTWITNGGGSNPIIGISQAGFDITQGASGELGYRSNGNKFDQSATETAYGATWTTGDVIGVAVDMDGGTIVFYKNGTSQGTAFTTVLTALTQPVSPMFRVNVAGDVLAINFGQRPFTYTPPSGFVALNTYNLSTPTIANGAVYMAATTYTGTGAALTIANTVNGTNFQPDLVWVKSRSAATDHKLTDVVRGVTKALISDTAGAETTDTNGLTAFGSTGFTLGTDTVYNNSAATYVAWQWKANGTGVSNTSGSITSTVSANTTAGFSVVTWTGNGVNAATVGHGLGVAPSMIIVKSRTLSAAGTGAWYVYHSGIGAANYLVLNTTAAQGTGGQWFSTAPTSSYFWLGGTGNNVNESGSSQVAYCFAAVAGYSAFGSYTGNGSTDGVFVYTGFRPRFLLTRRTDSAAGWIILDSARSPNNVAQNILEPQSAGADTGSTYNVVDFLSNGFKFRIAGDPNTAGASNIYMAFAENPTKFANAR